MSVGYGRGYYGASQLESRPPRRGGWIKLALVVGVGAAIWFWWPRKSPPLESPRTDDQAPAPSPPQNQLALPSNTAAPEGTQLATTHGYPSQQAYEDAVVASARQLQDAGAQVLLAPHLQHLAPRLTT